MRLRLQNMTFGLGLALALVVVAAPAEAGFMATVSETTTSFNSLTQYTYTVTDLAASTDSIGSFSLTVPTDANLSSIAMPTGFLAIYTPGDVTLEFASTDSSYDIAPGQSGMFQFLSPDKPGSANANFALTDYNNSAMFTGSVIGPAAVPEPGSLILLGLGLPLAAATLARRRSRKSIASA